MATEHNRRSTDPPLSPLAPDPTRRRLTERERQIALLVAAGLKDAAIANRLWLSVPTIRVNVRRILERLRLEDRGELAAWVDARRDPHGGLRRGENEGAGEAR